MLSPSSIRQPLRLAETFVLLSWMRTARGAVSQWRRRRRAIAQLQALSDWSLADIGIERSEIASVVRMSYRDASRRGR